MASALVGTDLCKGALSHRTVLLRGAGEVHDVERELERQRVRLGLLGQHDLHAQAELQRTAANKHTHKQTNKALTVTQQKRQRQLPRRSARSGMLRHACHER